MKLSTNPHMYDHSSPYVVYIKMQSFSVQWNEKRNALMFSSRYNDVFESHLQKHPSPSSLMSFNCTYINNIDIVVVWQSLQHLTDGCPDQLQS